jgi:hypothetical protein
MYYRMLKGDILTESVGKGWHRMHRGEAATEGMNKLVPREYQVCGF